MPEVVRRTWLPTLLFAAPIFAFELIAASDASRKPPVGTLTLVVLIVVPLVWWLTTANLGRISLGRGAVAGAWCGACLVLLPATAFTILFLASGRVDAGMVWGAGFVILAGAMVLFVPIGAGIGVLTAALQGRRLRDTT